MKNNYPKNHANIIVKMTLTHTANGKYEYDTLYNGKTLDKWIEDVNRHNCNANKWNYFKLQKGNFGYDNLAVCITYVFQYIQENNKLPSLHKCCKLIHDGWIENYIYWRDNKPYNGKRGYKRPGNPLNDERRNNCAKLSYDDLPEDEQEKDKIIASYLLENIILKKPKKVDSDSDDNQKRKKSRKSDSVDNQKQKKSRKSDSDDNQKRKKSRKSESNSDSDSDSDDNQKRKKSRESDSDDNQKRKKLRKSDSDSDDNQKRKKSRDSDSDDNQKQKKSRKSDSDDNQKRKKSRKSDSYSD